MYENVLNIRFVVGVPSIVLENAQNCTIGECNNGVTCAYRFHRRRRKSSPVYLHWPHLAQSRRKDG